MAYPCFQPSRLQEAEIAAASYVPSGAMSLDDKFKAAEAERAQELAEAAAAAAPAAAAPTLAGLLESLRRDAGLLG